ncbi:unnamed protein product [Prorocentrum cordatum]|uniref:Uncharacterized protein n=1 Tax=Prorocentrum cordatum TaxID=2364126 RepID=A0ABN9R782_9DINO|nr:unnamed protein product [Polarella glacialis]
MAFCRRAAAIKPAASMSTQTERLREAEERLQETEAELESVSGRVNAAEAKAQALVQEVVNARAAKERLLAELDSRRRGAGGAGAAAEQAERQAEERVSALEEQLKDAAWRARQAEAASAERLAGLQVQLTGLRGHAVESLARAEAAEDRARSAEARVAALLAELEAVRSDNAAVHSRAELARAELAREERERAEEQRRKEIAQAKRHRRELEQAKKEQRLAAEKKEEMERAQAAVQELLAMRAQPPLPPDDAAEEASEELLARQAQPPLPRDDAAEEASEELLARQAQPPLPPDDAAEEASEESGLGTSAGGGGSRGRLRVRGAAVRGGEEAAVELHRAGAGAGAGEADAAALGGGEAAPAGARPAPGEAGGQLQQEVDALSAVVKERKTALAAAGLSPQEVNRDPEVAEMVSHLLRLKEDLAAASASTAEPRRDVGGGDATESSTLSEDDPATEEEKQELVEAIDALRTALKEETKYSDEDIASDPDVLALCEKLQAMGVDTSHITLRKMDLGFQHATRKQALSEWYRRKWQRRHGMLPEHFLNKADGKSYKKRKKLTKDFITQKIRRLSKAQRKRKTDAVEKSAEDSSTTLPRLTPDFADAIAADV